MSRVFTPGKGPATGAATGAEAGSGPTGQRARSRADVSGPAIGTRREAGRRVVNRVVNRAVTETAPPATPVATPKPASVTTDAPVNTERPRRAPRTPFMLLVVGLLCGGLVSLLLLNTVLAQDSFELNDLRTSTDRLRQQAEELDRQNKYLSQPGAVAEQAKGTGAVPDGSAPKFLGPGSLEEGSAR